MNRYSGPGFVTLHMSSAFKTQYMGQPDWPPAVSHLVPAAAEALGMGLGLPGRPDETAVGIIEERAPRRSYRKVGSPLDTGP